MKFHLNQAEGLNIFTALGDDHVFINQQRYAQPGLLVGAELIDTTWSNGRFDQLTEEHFAKIARLSPEVVLFGTGNRQRFPHPALTAPLINARIGLEIMDSRAACRTYNILVGEGRNAMVALIMPSV